MSNLRRRQLLLQHEIDRALVRQSSKLKKDLQTRRAMCTPENEVKTMINHLVATKPPKQRNPNLKASKSSPKIKITAEYEKEPSANVYFPRTADKAVTASSKDIDIFFSRKKTDNMGDQAKKKTEPALEMHRIITPSKQNKENIPFNKGRQLPQHRPNVKTPKQPTTDFRQTKQNKIAENNKR